MSAARLLFSFTHTPTQAEFDSFAHVSGDDNPIHVDADFSARTRFGRRVAHGMFLYTLIWARLRTAMPMAAAAMQTLKFPNPAFAGEALRCEATIEPAEGGGALVSTSLLRAQDGEPVCEATTLMDQEGHGS